MTPEQLKITVDETRSVSGLWLAPPKAHAAYVFAHSAGAGMTHASMNTIAYGLAERGIATLRYQFPYMESGSKRPDAPKLCHATVHAAVAESARRAPGLPLFAGGRSFGGRMTSQAQALEPRPEVRGLIFLGFPLHPAGKSSDERAAHLADVRIPMLFITGARDDLAHLDLLRPVIVKLSDRATLHVLEHADHSFHVQARSGRKNDDVRAEALDAFGLWISRVLNR